MLTQKPKETPYVWVFKLATGEEIIARVTEETLGHYVIKAPLQMVMGARGPQFGPFIMMANPDKIQISKAHVVADSSPVAELEGQYESITSGIALPQKSSIIT
jgi:hypothetical protein